MSNIVEAFFVLGYTVLYKNNSTPISKKLLKNCIAYGDYYSY